jgi:hypothetical protein
MCAFVTLSSFRPSIILTLKYNIRNINRKLWPSFSFNIPKELSAKHINLIAFSKRINFSGKKITFCSCYKKTSKKIA